MSYSIEKTLEDHFGKCIDKGRVDIVKQWEELDYQILKSRKKVWMVKDIRERTIYTPWGLLTFRRRRYQNKITKKYKFLLDEKLKLEKYKFVTCKYRKLALFYYKVFKSYKEIALNVYGGQVSKMSIHRFIEEQEPEFGMQNYKCENDGILWINADGLWLNRHSSSKEPQSKVEVKNFAFFTGRSVDRNKRHKLDGRVLKSFIEEDRASMVIELRKIISGFEDVREIRLIGDGANWIKGIAKELNATYYIDKFHIRKALRDVYGKYNYRQALNIYSRNNHGRWLKVRLLRLLANPKTGEVNSKHLKLIGYLVNNHQAYIRACSDHTIGVIEAMQAHFVARYLKNQRKGFNMKTLTNILSVLTSWANGSWSFEAIHRQEVFFDTLSHRDSKNVPIFNYGDSSSRIYKRLQHIVMS